MQFRELLRLRVDFNYGRGGFVYLNPKLGDRSGLSSDVVEQFRIGDVSPIEGLRVLLWDPRSDTDDDGITCDMEVTGELQRDSNGWWGAAFDGNAIRWIPSDT